MPQIGGALRGGGWLPGIMQHTQPQVVPTSALADCPEELRVELQECQRLQPSQGGSASLLYATGARQSNGRRVTLWVSTFAMIHSNQDWQDSHRDSGTIYIGTDFSTIIQK